MSDLIGNPEDRFFHVTAHLSFWHINKHVSYHMRKPTFCRDVNLGYADRLLASSFRKIGIFPTCFTINLTWIFDVRALLFPCVCHIRDPAIKLCHF